MDTTTETRTEKGVSLARGPALILGTILEVAGLYFLYKQHVFPKLSNFPNGAAPVQGKVFLGIFGANGWTGLLTAAAGGLLLFGAAQHLLAKTMSLIVGITLGAAAVIAVVSGNVLGLAAANNWTKIGWGASALILLFNTLIPRRTRTVADPAAVDHQAMTTAPTRRAAAEPVETRTSTAADQPADTAYAEHRAPVTEAHADRERAVDHASASDRERANEGEGDGERDDETALERERDAEVPARQPD